MSGPPPQADAEAVIEARAKAEEMLNELTSGVSSNSSEAPLPVPEGSSVARVAEEKARRIEMLSLAIAGFSTAQLAERFKISETAVASVISRTLSEAENRTVEQARVLENQRLDRAQAAIWQQVISGDLKAIGVFLKISQERSKINGSYAATRIEMNVGIKHEMEVALRDLENLMQEQANYIVEAEVVEELPSAE